MHRPLPRSACDVLAQAGTARVQQLGLRHTAAGGPPQLRRQRWPGAGSRGQHAQDDISDGTGAATDAEFAAAAQRCLRAHIDSLQQWVVVAVRGMRRSLRRTTDEAGVQADVVQMLAEYVTHARNLCGPDLHNAF
jgi:hypothetical protein